MSKELTSRTEDYSKWYNDLVVKADLADHSAVRGCMVIKPYGYGIWENMQKALDKMFKDTGHQNAYFPLFIPKSLFEAEGSEIYLKPVTEYVSQDGPVDFYTIIESARRKGHSAFGYRLEHLAEDSSAAFGIQVNPNKSTKIQFNANDKIIVLAEN